MALEQFLALHLIEQEELNMYDELDEYILQKLADHYGPKPFSQQDPDGENGIDPVQMLADFSICPSIPGLTSEMIKYFQKNSVLTPEQEKKVMDNPRLLTSFQCSFELDLAGEEGKKHTATVLIFLTGVENHRPTFQISTTTEPEPDEKYYWCEETRSFAVKDFAAGLEITCQPSERELPSVCSINPDHPNGFVWVVTLYNTCSHAGPTITLGQGIHPFPLHFENYYYQFDRTFVDQTHLAFKKFRKWLRE